MDPTNSRLSDIDRMSDSQREKLKEWHLGELDQLFDELLENDLTFKATMEALSAADEWDISDLEYDVAGDAAEWAANGYTEKEWFAELPSNKFMQCSFTLNHISPHQTEGELNEAIETLKFIGLWPWA